MKVIKYSLVIFSCNSDPSLSSQNKNPVVSTTKFEELNKEIKEKDKKIEELNKKIREKENELYLAKSNQLASNQANILFENKKLIEKIEEREKKIRDKEKILETLFTAKNSEIEIPEYIVDIVKNKIKNLSVSYKFDNYKLTSKKLCEFYYIFGEKILFVRDKNEIFYNLKNTYIFFSSSINSFFFNQENYTLHFFENNNNISVFNENV